jgi:hypothetical protein
VTRGRGTQRRRRQRPGSRATTSHAAEQRRIQLAADEALATNEFVVLQWRGRPVVLIPDRLRQEAEPVLGRLPAAWQLVRPDGRSVSVFRLSEDQYRALRAAWKADR